MITFTCDSCGKAFSVSDKLAGRRGKCKGCGKSLLIPSPDAEQTTNSSSATTSDDFPPGHTSPQAASPVDTKPEPSSSKKLKVPPRTRRLIADAEKLRTALAGFPLIQIQQAAGNPPDRYRVVYNVRSLVRDPDGNPIFRDQHAVEIQLTQDYPRQSPKCKMLTPIFHPNIEPAMICVGDHWTAGERLIDLVIRIGEMLGYQAYNIKSPLDGEAAMWADKNPNYLPTDSRDMRPPKLD